MSKGYAAVCPLARKPLQGTGGLEHRSGSTSCHPGLSASGSE